MDNLGVLKVIADALNNSSSNLENKKSPQKNFNLDGIMQLINQFKPKDNQKVEDETPKNKTENSSSATLDLKAYPIAPPLQSRMIATMTSHENFIKRVKEKNKTPWRLNQGVI